MKPLIKLRTAYIAHRFQNDLFVSRQELVVFFHISTAQASLVLKEFMANEKKRGNDFEYDFTRKGWVLSKFNTAHLTYGKDLISFESAMSNLLKAYDEIRNLVK